MSITDLHDDLIIDIMLCMSPKDLVRCLCTLKSWNALISGKVFRKLYFARSLETNNHRILIMAEEQVPDYLEPAVEFPKDYFSAEFKPSEEFGDASIIVQPLRRPGRVRTKIVGCCHGLVCLNNEDYVTRDLAVWNPSIQKFRRIPPAPIEVPTAVKSRYDRDRRIMYGFGYDPSTDDYKVVRVCTFRNSNVTLGSDVRIYSLENMLWNKIESLLCKWDSKEAIPLKGALHWFGQLDPIPRGVRVLSLELGNQVFKEFGTPFGIHDAIGLRVLGENLCAGVYMIGERHHIWVLTQYGVSESWQHFYTIEQAVVELGFGPLLPLAISRTGKGILLHDFCEETDGNLLWYDPDKDTAAAVHFDGMPQAFDAVVCVADLRLLDGDPVIVPRRQQVRPIKKRIGSSEGEGSTEQAKQGDST